jgi:hypothetical protein
MDTRTRTEICSNHEELGTEDGTAPIPSARGTERDLGGELPTEDVESNIVRGID